MSDVDLECMQSNEYMQLIAKVESLDKMPIFGDKPYTSITVKVNQLCAKSDDDESIELFLGDLLSLIGLQSTGASEAARAIRKKIKHGLDSEAYQAVSLLELLVLNGGLALGKSIARDERLVSVLKNVVQGLKSGSGLVYNADVVRKTRNIAVGWKSELRDLSGLEPLAQLYKSIPRTSKTPRPHPDLVPRSLRHEDSDTNFTQSPRRHSPRTPQEEAARPSAPPRPKAMSPAIRREDPAPSPRERRKKKSRSGKKQVYADSQFKIPQINYKVEAPKIRSTLGDCQTHVAGLNNALLTLPQGREASMDSDVQNWFKKCRTTRRAVLRYLQFVGAGNLDDKLLDVRELDEEFLGSLIAANDQLVGILTKYDRACGINVDKNYEEPSSESEAEFYTSESESSEEEYDKRPPQVPSLSESPPASPIPDFRKPPTMDLKTLTSDNPFGDP